MNSLNTGHRLTELIARRKAGLIGEFSYVCLRTERGEILELVKEKDKEGWERLNSLCGESMSMADSKFEAKVRKLVSKLPWEREPLFNVKTEINNDGAVVKTETNKEIKEEHKEEFKEEPKEEYEEFKEQYIEEYKDTYKKEYIEEYTKEEFKVKIKVEVDDDRESDFRSIAAGIKGEDIIDGKSLAADINSGMNFGFAGQKEFFNKSFIKAETPGSVWNRVGNKKDLPHDKTDARPRPCEEELVKAVKDYYCAFLINPNKRKHVTIHLQKLYGNGQFQEFGFGTFKEFLKKHGLDDQTGTLNQREKITTNIQRIIGKVRTPHGHYFCDPCGADLNLREAREHIENCHSSIYSQVSQLTEWYGREYTNNAIEEILRNLPKVNNNAKKDILSRLSKIFFRSGNIYHCIICGNMPIGREKHQAKEHLSMCHAKEEMAMKEFIKLKYDPHVDKNFGKFLRLVLHRVESF